MTSDEAWHDLVRTHPALIVEMTVLLLKNTDNKIGLDVLSRNMPLHKLYWDHVHEVTSNFEVHMLNINLRMSVCLSVLVLRVFQISAPAPANTKTGNCYRSGSDSCRVLFHKSGKIRLAGKVMKYI